MINKILSAPKWLLYSVGALISAFFLYLLYIAFTNFNSLLERFGFKRTVDEQKQDEALTKAIQKGYKVPVFDKLSLDESAWVTLANSLYEGLKDQLDFFRDYNAAFKALYSVKSISDWNQLQRSFGKRDLNPAFGVSFSTVDLVTYLRKKLTSESINDVNLYYRNKGLKISI